MKKFSTCKILMLLFLFINTSLAKDFILSDKYKKSQQNSMATAMLNDYERFINKIKNKPLNTKLKAINNYINTINSIDDNPHDAMIDRWATRTEFFKKGGGDCEDYAIAKYYTLKDLHVDDDKMCLIVVKEKYSGFGHMVLGIWNNENNSPLILDNLSFRVLPLKDRVDLKPSYCMNENGYYTINAQGQRTKTNIRFKAYESMLKRNQNEHLWK